MEVKKAEIIKTKYKEEPSAWMAMNMNERRKQQERRCFIRTASFPLIDSDEYVILTDRRINPCRRLGNIAIEWICVYDFHEMPMANH